MTFKVEQYQVNEGGVETKRGEMQMEKSDVGLDREDTFVSKPGTASQPVKPKPKKGKFTSSTGTLLLWNYGYASVSHACNESSTSVGYLKRCYNIYIPEAMGIPDCHSFWGPVPYGAQQG